MFQRLRRWFEKLLLEDRSIQRLATSFCLGTFIGLTPTIPLMTWLVLGIAWLFGLNVTVAMAALYIVNNPITMIPYYIIGYAVGVWFFSSVLVIDMRAYDPYWVDSFNTFLSKYIDVEKYLGADLCFWYLVIGGFIFASLVTLVLYPLLVYVLTRIALKLEKKKNDESYSEK